MLSKDKSSHYLHYIIINVVSNYSVSDSPSWEEIRNVHRLERIPGDDPMRCFDSSFNFFSILFCNIHGLCSNFHSVEHNLSLRPHLVFLTETQVSSFTNNNFCCIPSYFLFSKFNFTAGCCVCIHNDITCSHHHHLGFC